MKNKILKNSFVAVFIIGLLVVLKYFFNTRQLVKDFAQLIKRNGEKINGKLILSNDNLIFLGNGYEEKVLEKDVREINPIINTRKFLGIPNGFKIENDEILLIVPFPYYWLKRIDKRKRIKTTACKNRSANK